jgi:hypothetical protein
MLPFRFSQRSRRTAAVLCSAGLACQRVGLQYIGSHNTNAALIRSISPSSLTAYALSFTLVYYPAPWPQYKSLRWYLRRSYTKVRSSFSTRIDKHGVCVLLWHSSHPLRRPVHCLRREQRWRSVDRPQKREKSQPCQVTGEA